MATAIINGKRYNTDTAELIYSHSKGPDKEDSNYVCETLYKTQKGAFFIHGEGGPMTEYAVSRGSSTYNGERIDAKTPDEALAWLSSHQDPEASKAAAEHFAELIVEA